MVTAVNSHNVTRLPRLQPANDELCIFSSRAFSGSFAAKPWPSCKVRSCHWGRPHHKKDP